MMSEKSIGANKNFLLSPSAEKIQFLSQKFCKISPPKNWLPDFNWE